MRHFRHASDNGIHMCLRRKSAMVNWKKYINKPAICDTSFLAIKDPQADNILSNYSVLLRGKPCYVHTVLRCSCVSIRHLSSKVTVAVTIITAVFLKHTVTFVIQAPRTLLPVYQTERCYETEWSIFQYISNKMQRCADYYIWKLLYMFQAVPPPIIRSAYNCIYSIWYLSHRYCYLPLSWKSWNWFECAVGGVRLF
jgi:hypothetical protein